MLYSKKLIKFKRIKHAFFDRREGFSKGVYKSLNCGLGSNDNINNINKNLDKVCKKIGCNKNNLILLNQIHSNIVHKVEKIPKKKLKGDSLITNKKGIALGILTADCAPVFIYDPINGLISALHAGWKGAYKNILIRVVKFMLKKDCHIKDIYVAIGPCISQKNYNVKEDFFKKFIKKDKKNSKFFKKRKNLLYFDLPGYIKSQLKIMKISNIDHINIDTFEYKNNYFSARRSIRLKHDDYGRNISIIMIN